jgi:hypothetical protein
MICLCASRTVFLSGRKVGVPEQTHSLLFLCVFPLSPRFSSNESTSPQNNMPPKRNPSITSTAISSKSSGAAVKVFTNGSTKETDDSKHAPPLSRTFILAMFARRKSNLVPAFLSLSHASQRSKTSAETFFKLGGGSTGNNVILQTLVLSIALYLTNLS